MGKTKQFTQEEVASILTQYQAGKSCTKIATSMHCDVLRIKRVLEEHGIEIVPKKFEKRLYHLNRDFFNNCNEASAYWLGFIAADGCLSRPSKDSPASVLSIGLAAKDRDHIEKFKKAIGASHKLYEYAERKPTTRFVVNDIEFVKTILAHNIGPRKSLVYDPKPNLPQKLMHHFWRGMIDGDGYVSNRRNALFCGLCGSLNTVQAFADFFDLPQAIVVSNVKSDTPTYGIHLSYLPAAKLLDRLYVDATIWLDRKHDAYEKGKLLLQGRVTRKRLCKSTSE